MKIVLVAAGGIVVLLVGFVIWRFVATVVATRRTNDRLFSAIEPVVSAVRDGSGVPEDRLAELSRRPDTRSILYRALYDLDRIDLMPEEYRTLSAIAESDLSAWLMHPNELGSVPGEIELAQEIERDEGGPTQKYRFFVFKFRMKPPHRASKDGWMAGVAGPYWDGEQPLESPPGVFSRFESFESASPDEHLRRTEELILRKV